MNKKHDRWSSYKRRPRKISDLDYFDRQLFDRTRSMMGFRKFLSFEEGVLDLGKRTEHLVAAMRDAERLTAEDLGTMVY